MSFSISALTLDRFDSLPRHVRRCVFWEVDPENLAQLSSGPVAAAAAAGGRTDFISEFGLARSEGVVLRYLTDCYRALNSGLPMSAVTDEIEDITDELGDLIRGVDSSLIDEWEALTSQEVTSQEV